MDVNTALMSISKGQLNNFKEYRTRGDILADKIFKILSSRSAFPISRVKIAGSIGKKTSLGVQDQPDFDLAVFINKQQPPFKNILEDFKKALFPYNKSQAFFPEYNITLVAEKMTPHSIQFKAKDGNGAGDYFSFDLLPAANLLDPLHEHLTAAEREEIQTARALKLISELRDPKRDSSCYSSSMCERTIAFVSERSPFVHDVIRLVKLWNKNVTCPRFYGRSMMMELVSIWAAVTEEQNARRSGQEASISSAFKLVLNMFLDFDKNMVVLFTNQANPNQKALCAEYERQTTTQRPIILDPVNPYNNLARNVQDGYQMKRAFSAHAHNTLAAVKSYGRFGSHSSNLASHF